jgi:hypothetical protein
VDEDLVGLEDEVVGIFLQCSFHQRLEGLEELSLL